MTHSPLEGPAVQPSKDLNLPNGTCHCPRREPYPGTGGVGGSASISVVDVLDVRLEDLLLELVVVKLVAVLVCEVVVEEKEVVLVIVPDVRVLEDVRQVPVDVDVVVEGQPFSSLSQHHSFFMLDQPNSQLP